MKECFVYVVMNYDYDSYDEAIEEFDYTDCESICAPSKVFTNAEAALTYAIDAAKEEADIFTDGTPADYQITVNNYEVEGPECKAVIVHFLDDNTASVWAMHRVPLMSSYEPKMSDDIIVSDCSDVTKKNQNIASEEEQKEYHERLTKIQELCHQSAKAMLEAEKLALGLE